MFKVLFALGIGIGILALVVLLIQWAFNVFISPTFGVPQIDFVQAIAATVLFVLLRGSASTAQANSARLR